MMFRSSTLLLVSVLWIGYFVNAQETGSGQTDANGCSDYSQDDGTGGFVCMCHRTCFELSSDELTCMPQVSTTFSDDHLQISVPKCAADGFLSLGGYNEDDVIPTECQYAETDTDFVFNVTVGECGTTVDDTITTETRYRGILSIWIEDPQSDTHDPLISRDGKWYTIESFTTTEQSFNVSESFSPTNNNGNISLTAEDPFAPVTLSFDFFRTDAFAEAYDEAEYPISYTLGDSIYFGLNVETTDTDVELFTSSCVAEPTPNPNLIGTYVLRDQGCNEDTTVVEHPSDDPLKNHFSVNAFQFKEGLEGITGETDVTIQCTAVICLADMASSTCSQGCATATVSKRSIRNGRSVPVIREVKQLLAETDEFFTESGPRTVTSPPIHIYTSGALKFTTNIFLLVVTALFTLNLL